MLPNVHDPTGKVRRIISGATTRHGGSDRANVGPRHPDGVSSFGSVDKSAESDTLPSWPVVGRLGPVGEVEVTDFEKVRLIGTNDGHEIAIRLNKVIWDIHREDEMAATLVSESEPVVGDSVEQYRDLLSQEPLKEEYQKSVTAALTKLIDVIITARSGRGATVRSRRTHPV